MDLANDYLDHCNKFVTDVQAEKKRVFSMLFEMVEATTTVNHFANRPKLGLDFVAEAYNHYGGNVANNCVRKNMKAAWNWGKKFIRGFPNVNPFDLIDDYPENRKPRYVPPLNDFWTVYDGDYEYPPSKQDKLMLLTYLYTAARRSELFRIKISTDLDFETGRIRLTDQKSGGKGWCEAWLPMLDELYKLLFEHVQTCTSDYLFLDPDTGEPYKERRNIMAKWCERAGVKTFGWHGIRHLSATVLAQNNVPMEQIQQILRHSNLSTTEKYVGRLGVVKSNLEVLSNRQVRQEVRQSTSRQVRDLKLVGK
jgi:integrase